MYAPLLTIAAVCPLAPLPALTGFTLRHSHTVKFGCSPHLMWEAVTPGHAFLDHWWAAYPDILPEDLHVHA